MHLWSVGKNLTYVCTNHAFSLFDFVKLTYLRTNTNKLYLYLHMKKKKLSEVVSRAWEQPSLLCSILCTCTHTRTHTHTHTHTHTPHAQVAGISYMLSEHSPEKRDHIWKYKCKTYCLKNCGKDYYHSSCGTDSDCQKCSYSTCPDDQYRVGVCPGEHGTENGYSCKKNAPISNVQKTNTAPGNACHVRISG